MPAMKRLPMTLATALCALAAAASGKPADPVAVAFTLEPKKVHEECMRLEAGQSRKWHWKSDQAVDFNIHYHRGNDVFYPVKRDAMRGDGGSFTAKTGEDYCWMWTARERAAKVEGAIAR